MSAGGGDRMDTGVRCLGQIAPVFPPNTPWEDMGCPGQIAPFFTLWEETPPAAAATCRELLYTLQKMSSDDFDSPKQSFFPVLLWTLEEPQAVWYSFVSV